MREHKALAKRDHNRQILHHQDLLILIKIRNKENQMLPNLVHLTESEAQVEIQMQPKIAIDQLLRRIDKARHRDHHPDKVEETCKK